jgi:hypothetical protein
MDMTEMEGMDMSEVEGMYIVEEQDHPTNHWLGEEGMNIVGSNMVEVNCMDTVEEHFHPMNHQSEVEGMYTVNEHFHLMNHWSEVEDIDTVDIGMRKDKAVELEAGAGGKMGGSVNGTVRALLPAPASMSSPPGAIARQAGATAFGAGDSPRWNQPYTFEKKREYMSGWPWRPIVMVDIQAVIGTSLSDRSWFLFLIIAPPLKCPGRHTHIDRDSNILLAIR